MGKKIMVMMLILFLSVLTAYAQTTGMTDENTGTGTNTGTTTGTNTGTDTGTTGSMTTGYTDTMTDWNAMKNVGFDQRDRFISMLENRNRTMPDMKRKTDDQIRRLRNANQDSWESVRDSVLNEIK